MNNQAQTYWEQQKIDPANYCPERGEYPHPGCDVEMYEAGGLWSHVYGVCHGHKTVWHLQSRGAAQPHPALPTLAELTGKGYSYYQPDQ